MLDIRTLEPGQWVKFTSNCPERQSIVGMVNDLRHSPFDAVAVELFTPGAPFSLARYWEDQGTFEIVEAPLAVG
jgi:hypothetical protein